MLISPPSRRRLGALAAACLLSVALPAAPAWAQKTKTKSEATTEASAPAPQPVITVEIPSVESVSSNVDDATLEAILKGDLVDNAEALAGLTADSITIPEIVLNTKLEVEGETKNSTVTFSNIVLSDVTDGVASSISLDGATITSDGDMGSGDFGALSASNFDIAGVLGIYGLVDSGGQTDLETIYTDFNFDGGTITTPDVSCTIGAMTAAEFKARPLKYTAVEITALAQTLSEQEDNPDPKVIGQALRMYVDLFTAFESSPVKFDGFDCSGVDENDRPLDFKVASMSMEGMSPGTYPQISMDGLDITVEGGRQGLGRQCHVQGHGPVRPDRRDRGRSRSHRRGLAHRQCPLADPGLCRLLGGRCQCRRARYHGRRPAHRRQRR